jgi:large subunit ribosomal protein L31e
MAEKKASKDKPAEERLLTVPLRREWLKATMNRRARRSITAIRSHISRHMNVPEADIRISARLNDSIWIRGAGRPPARIRLKASLDASTGMLHAMLPDEELPKPEKKKGEKHKEEAAKPGEANAAPAGKPHEGEAGKPGEPEGEAAPTEKPKESTKPAEPQEPKADTEKHETEEKPKTEEKPDYKKK